MGVNWTITCFRGINAEPSLVRQRCMFNSPNGKAYWSHNLSHNSLKIVSGTNLEEHFLQHMLSLPRTHQHFGCWSLCSCISSIMCCCFVSFVIVFSLTNWLLFPKGISVMLSLIHTGLFISGICSAAMKKCRNKTMTWQSKAAQLKQCSCSRCRH